MNAGLRGLTDMLLGSRRPAGRQTLLVSAALMLLVLIAYLPSLNAGFIWDDDDYLTENRVVQDPSGLWKIWFEPQLSPQYYPLTQTSFWLDVRLWGLNPLPFHLENILLQGLNAALLWLVLSHIGVPGALLAAALFGIHPVNVESVAWVTERKNVLSGLFYLLTTLAWLRFRPLDEAEGAGADRKGLWYGLSLVLFLCAMFSKVTTVTWPAVILLLVWWKKGRIERRDILPVIPFLLLGAVVGLGVTWWEKHFVGAKGYEWAFSVSDRILIAGRTLCFYAEKIFWPWKLTFIYPRWQIDSANLFQWAWPLSAVGTLAALWLGRHRLGRGPVTAALYFTGNLAPVLGFLNIYWMRFSFVADHFQYLATIGPIALAAALIGRAAAGRTTLALVCSGAILITGAGLTWNQSRIYLDQETLWKDTLAKNPSAWIAWTNLGTFVLQSGRVGEAEEYFNASLLLKEDQPVAYNGLGTVYENQGRLPEAAASFRRAISLDQAAEYHSNLGFVLAKQQLFQEALNAHHMALKINPSYANALFGIASVHETLGQYVQAADYWRKFISSASDPQWIQLARERLRFCEQRSGAVIGR